MSAEKHHAANAKISCPACGGQGMVPQVAGSWECRDCGKILKKRKSSDPEDAVKYGRRYNDKKIEAVLDSSKAKSTAWRQPVIIVILVAAVVILTALLLTR